MSKASNPLPTCDNETSRRGAGYTSTALTHRLDSGERQAAVKATQVCSIQDCDGAAIARSWCRKHYSRWRKVGDPRAPLYRHDPRLRFDRKVDRNTPRGCWQWLGSTNRGGYGLLSVQGKYVAAHRWAYETFVGPIPEGLVIDHLCRNPGCVNPEHLEPVTVWTNTMRGAAPTILAHHRRRCFRGHLVDGDNLYVPPSRPTWRVCRTCKARHQKGQ